MIYQLIWGLVYELQRVHFKLSDHDKKEQCKCAAGYDP